MNKYELALFETRSVLEEWIDPLIATRTTDISIAIVERLISKGVIQSTDPNDLLDFRDGEPEP